MSLVAEGLGKRYWLHGPAPASFQQVLGRAWHSLRRGTPFWALREVSFRVAPGERVGLVGRNGAGKTTLLRLLCGVGRPTTGRAAAHGRVAALLELGTGFHPLLTGRENLQVNAVLAGMRRARALACQDSIIAFAELAEFIDEPLRTYSAGMRMRLAFAIAVHADPDVLMVDEALAVGDARFQQKCYERIEHFRRQGRTLLLVSHDAGQLRRFCDRVLWLEGGRLVGDGPAEAVLAAYAGG